MDERRKRGEVIVDTRVIILPVNGRKTDILVILLEKRVPILCLGGLEHFGNAKYYNEATLKPASLRLKNPALITGYFNYLTIGQEVPLMGLTPPTMCQIRSRI